MTDPGTALWSLSMVCGLDEVPLNYSGDQLRNADWSAVPSTGLLVRTRVALFILLSDTDNLILFWMWCIQLWNLKTKIYCPLSENSSISWNQTWMSLFFIKGILLNWHIKCSKHKKIVVMSIFLKLYSSNTVLANHKRLRLNKTWLFCMLPKQSLNCISLLFGSS